MPLVLERDIDEVIVIGEAGTILSEPILVKLVSTKTDRARLAITAPRDVPVHRQEVVDAILRDGPRLAELGNGGVKHVGSENA